MKKLPILVSGLLFLTVIIGTTSCGPSKEEQARLDSIRVADSLHRVDSIRIVDSLAQARKAEQEAAALHDKIDQEAKALSSKMAIKMYDLNKIVYIGKRGDRDQMITSSVCIKNVATGEVKTISLPNSAELAGITSLEAVGGNKVKAFVHWGGSGPFYNRYTIDVDKEKITSVEEDG